MKLVIRSRKYHMTHHSSVPVAETLKIRAGCCQLRYMSLFIEAL